MSEKLNEDGLIAGQDVDYATMIKIELQRKAKQAEPKPAKKPATKKVD